MSRILHVAFSSALFAAVVLRPAPTRAQPAEPDTVRLSVRGARSAPLSLYRSSASGTWALFDSWSVICAAPCERDVPRGDYVFGVGLGAGNPIRASAPRTLDGDLALEIDMDDRSGLRTAGWVAAVGGLVVGLGALLIGAAMIDAAQSDRSRIDNGLETAGIGVFGAALGTLLVVPVVGLVLIFLNDVPSLRVL